MPPCWRHFQRYGYGGFVQLCHTCPGKADMTIDGKLFRKVEANCWSLEERIKDMDRTGEQCSRNKLKWFPKHNFNARADSRFAPSQWESASLYNDVSHWLGSSIESALPTCYPTGQPNGYNTTYFPMWFCFKVKFEWFIRSPVSILNHFLLSFNLVISHPNPVNSILYGLS